MKLLLSGFCSQYLEVGLMRIWMSVYLFKIHHCFFWEFRAYIYKVANLGDMVREVVQKMHQHKVGIQFVDTMFCNFWRNLHFMFIHMTTLCSHRKIVSSRVTLLFILFVQSKLLFQVFWNLLCRFPSMESTENILMKMKLLQIMIHELNHGLRMVPVLSVSNGCSFGPGRFYRSVWQRLYPIKNRRFFKRTIALWLQIWIREFNVWYIKYVALYGASSGRLRFSISSNLSKR